MINNYYRKDDFKYKIATCSDGTGKIIDMGDRVCGTVSRETMLQLRTISMEYLNYTGPDCDEDWT